MSTLLTVNSEDSVTPFCQATNREKISCYQRVANSNEWNVSNGNAIGQGSNTDIPRHLKCL